MMTCFFFKGIGNEWWLLHTHIPLRRSWIKEELFWDMGKKPKKKQNNSKPFWGTLGKVGQKRGKKKELQAILRNAWQGLSSKQKRTTLQAILRNAWPSHSEERLVKRLFLKKRTTPSHSEERLAKPFFGTLGKRLVLKKDNSKPFFGTLGQAILRNAW